MPPLEGRTIRRNFLQSADGSTEISCDAFVVDAFGDARLIYEAPMSNDGMGVGLTEIASFLSQRIAPL